MFERILLTTDFSDHSLTLLEATLALARVFGSRILLLHVDEEEQLFALRGSDSLIRFLRDVQLRRNAAMDRIARRIAAAGVPVETLRAKGLASEQILAVARSHEVDLLAISTIGVERHKQTLIGSTAKQVLRHAPCPVLITNPYCRQAELLPGAEEEEGATWPAGWLGGAREEALGGEAEAEVEAEAQGSETEADLRAGSPDEGTDGRPGAGAMLAPAPPDQQRPPRWPPFARVLAPLSLEEQPPAAIQFAAAVAAGCQAKLELLSVLKVPTYFPGVPGEPPLNIPAEALAPFQGEATTRLAELAAALPHGDTDWSVTLAADEAEEITAHAARSHADLVIVARRASSALGELLFGRVASAVAKTCPAPMLMYVPPPRS